MTVFDWLEGIALPTGASPFGIVEMRFKANRKGFYRVSSGLEVQVGDVVCVDTDPGHDVGVVSMRGELVKAQMKATGVKDDHTIKKVVRIATQEDIDAWQKVRLREDETKAESRKIISRIGLDMKLSDVEFQGDGKKASFYYTAGERVDFRLLVRELASAFGVRVDMRQIGARQEAARVGGIGVCGRELCCSSWLTDFRSVSTSAARYQQMSLNPQKLAGQCGKLKCCLNFELDQYVESVSEFPSPNTKIRLKKGKAVVFKMDIFKRVVYLLNLDDMATGPVPVALADMKEMMAMNEAGDAPSSLSEFVIEEEPDEVEELYSSVVGQDSLNRFDDKKGGRNKRRRPNSGAGKRGAGKGGRKPSGRPSGNAAGKSGSTSGDSAKSAGSAKPSVGRSSRGRNRRGQSTESKPQN
jgi:cell fate regulator YaaT (PSP1 superfamily)